MENYKIKKLKKKDDPWRLPKVVISYAHANVFGIDEECSS